MMFFIYFLFLLIGKLHEGNQNITTYTKDYFLQRLNHALFPHLVTSGTAGGYVPGHKIGKSDFYSSFFLSHSERGNPVATHPSKADLGNEML